MKLLEEKWLEDLQKLDIVFQPIVSIQDGRLYGVEALLRGVQEIGYASIADFFNRAYCDNVLYTLDLALREKVIQKFTTLKDYNRIKLFINLDNRLFEMPNFSAGNTQKLLKRYHLNKEMVCFELSEQHAISNITMFEEVLKHYKSESYSIAVDDFGVGVSGYQMLYRSTPEFIKIDRFFIDTIFADTKKKILVQSIVQLATQLGIVVIAEGIEDAKELEVCHTLGCHLVQGYYIQKPQYDTGAILEYYDHIPTIKKGSFIKNRLQRLSPFLPRIASNILVE